MIETRRLRFLARVEVSNVDKKSRDGEAAVWLCNYVDVYYHERIAPGMEFMSATATREQVERFTLRAGDILITKDSETPDDIAAPALVAEDLDGVVCGYHLAILRPDPDLLDSRYLFWVLTSRTSRTFMSSNAFGITRYGLRRDAILDLPVPVRSLAHQRALSDYLDAQTARIDRLAPLDRRPSASGGAGEIGRMVDLLRERRDALITAAVTGQLEIPGAAA